MSPISKCITTVITLMTLYAIWGFFCTAEAEPRIVINEILASNNRTYSDEDGDYEDWIELYNAGSDTADLSFHGLSDDYDRPFRWTFPEGVLLAPGDYLLVWASGKDRRDFDGELHTSFSIAQAGEEVLLTHYETGERIDHVPPTRIPSDISYGRYPDGTDNWHFFNFPTPASPNRQPVWDDQVADPELSHTGGFYDGPITLTVASEPGTRLHYTLDGSEPDENDPLWPGTMTISKRQPDDALLSYIPTNPPEMPENRRWREPNEPPFLATTLRIRGFRDGAMPSRIVSNTYFVTGDKVSSTSENRKKENPRQQAAYSKYPVPVIAISTDPHGFFDHEDGIYIPGQRYDDGFFNPPWGMPYGNYFYRGEDWERPASFEYFEPGEGRVLAQDIGVRIHGSTSRSLPLKSFRLYARSEYGERRFEYPFFDHPDSHPNYEGPHYGPGDESPSYNRLILRNSGQDFFLFSTMFRDAMTQGLVDHLNFDTQASRPAVVFLNGEFWGIMNIRERYDRHYISRTYDIPDDRIDLMTQFSTVKEGSRDHYNTYRNYLSDEDKDIRDSTHYAHIKTLLDVDNFIDYNIVNIYIANRDWPGNNREFFRYQTEFNPDAGSGRDGRWRYMLIDTDYGFGHRDPSRGNGDPGDDALLNMRAIATGSPNDKAPNPGWSTVELSTLLENDTFRREFINRSANYMNTFFSPEYVRNHIRHYRENIEPVIEDHIDRWQYPTSVSNWDAHITFLKNFASDRPAAHRSHMIEYFDELADTIGITLDVSGFYGDESFSGSYDGEIDKAHADGQSPPRTGGHIRINDMAVSGSTRGIPEHPWPWKGTYFKDYPIAFTAVPDSGYVFEGWKEYPDHNDSLLTIAPGSNLKLTAVFRSVDTSAGQREDDDARAPEKFNMAQNYPNPFNNRTTIPYALPESGNVVFTIYSVDGRRVATIDEGMRNAGNHQLQLEAGDWASGIYVVRLRIISESGDLRYHKVRRITLIK